MIKVRNKLIENIIKIKQKELKILTFNYYKHDV